MKLLHIQQLVLLGEFGSYPNIYLSSFEMLNFKTQAFSVCLHRWLNETFPSAKLRIPSLPPDYKKSHKIEVYSWFSQLVNLRK